MTWTKSKIAPSDVDAKDDISVVVMDRVGTQLVGLLVDLSPLGIETRFFAPDEPALTLGDELDITFTSTRLKVTAGARVRVVQREDEHAARDFVLHFVDAEEVQTQLKELKGLFNRRDAYRVKPTLDLAAKVTVEVERGKPPVKGFVRDVSSTGMGLALPLEVERDHSLPTDVQIFLQLPGVETAMAVAARVCFRRIDGQAVVYGMRFDPDATTGFANIQDQIGRYVMAVQRAELARGRGRV